MIMKSRTTLSHLFPTIRMLMLAKVTERIGAVTAKNFILLMGKYASRMGPVLLWKPPSSNISCRQWKYEIGLNCINVIGDMES